MRRRAIPVNVTNQSKPWSAALLGAAIAISPSLSLADEPTLEAGAFVGGEDLGSGFELGNAYYADQAPGDGMVFGARIRYRLTRRLGLELEGTFTPAATAGRPDEGRYPVASPVLGVRAHATYDLLRLWRIDAFATAGVGADTVWFGAPDSYLVETDTDANAHWGAGARFAVGDRFGVRVDARQIIGYGRTDLAELGYEATAGLYFRFGSGGSGGTGAAQPAPVRTVVGSTRPAKAKRSALPPPRPRPRPHFEPAHTGLLAAVAEAEPVPVLAKFVGPMVKAEFRVPGKDEAPPLSDAAPIETVEAAQALLASVRYDHGSARIKHRARRALDRVAQYLDEQPLATILIVGHADAEGDARANVVLSRKRADMAKWYLVDRGITRDRIDTVGVGENEPIDSNDTDTGRARNRRIEIEVVN